MPKTGKQRAQRIDRQYHRLKDRFLVRKRWIGAFGFALALLYSAWLFSSRGTNQVSPGALSQAHSAFEVDCQRCHQAFTPIRTDALGGDSPVAIQRNNQSCMQNCHATTTGHFASTTRPEALQRESCSQCHHEHLGADHRLTNISDTNCVRCHAQLQDFTTHPIANQTVSSFSLETGHPAFAFESSSMDPSTLKFSHAQHLRPGQPSRPGGADAKGDRQLRCSDCHSRDLELQGFEFLESFEKLTRIPIVSTQAKKHQLYRPVEFQKHCVSCHDLNGIEHGLDRNKTQQSIDTLLPILQQQFVRSQSESPLPVDLKERETRLAALLSTSIDGCAKCHIAAPENSPAIVEPTQLRSRWLKQASFSHGSHLMVSCSKCHSQAYQRVEGRVDSIAEANQIMLPGIAICRECHIRDDRLRGQSTATNPHSASADCIDCHRYHVDTPDSGKLLRQSQFQPTKGDGKLSSTQSTIATSNVSSWKSYLLGANQP